MLCRLCFSGFPIFLVLLLWACSASGFALVDSMDLGVQHVTAIAPLGDQAMIPGQSHAVIIPQMSMAALSEHNFPMTPVEYGLPQEPLLVTASAPSLLRGADLGADISVTEAGSENRLVPQSTVLPVPPTVALLGLGSMLVLGFVRQGMSASR